MRSKPAVPKWSRTLSAESRISLSVIDMQKFFITDAASPWADPDLLRIVPGIKRLVRAIDPRNTVFTLFKPPVDWQDEERSWRTYYYENQGVTTEMLGTEAVEVIDELLPETTNPAATLVPKKTASAFSSERFRVALERMDTWFLVLCGIETDYCVLATALDALNRGYYVIIPMNACASSKGAAGQKNAEGIFERFPEQLWVTDIASLIEQLQGKNAGD